MRASMTPEEAGVYAEALAGFDERLASAGEDGDSPDEVADVIAEALTARRPDDRYPVGRGARSTTILQSLLPPAVFDRVKQHVTG